MPGRNVLHTLVACAAMAAGCAQDPEAVVCPPIGPGDVVVTELRPRQNTDLWGDWVELYNATGSELDLEGAVIDVFGIDGGNASRILIRHPLSIAPGDYLVVGNFADTVTPDHFDYDTGDSNDFAAFPPTGVVSLSACGVEIDHLTFPMMPASGSWSFGGAPTATGNDDEAAWCNDTTPSTVPNKPGLPGSPGAANIPCN